MQCVHRAYDDEDILRNIIVELGVVSLILMEVNVVFATDASRQRKSRRDL